MIYVLAALAGLACAALGALVGALITAMITALAGISDFEGARGMVIVWLGGPIGGVAGLIIGLWLVLRFYGGHRGFGAIAARSAGIIVALVALTGGGIMLMLATDATLNRNGAKPQLVFEIRFPPGTTLPPGLRGIEVELSTDRNTMPALLQRDRVRTGERPVLAGLVELAFRTSRRLIVLRMPGAPARLFSLKVPATPPHHDSFGPWQPVDFVADSEGQPRPAGGEQGFEIRYRTRDPNIEYTLPTVRFELGLPENMTPPARDTISVTVRNGDDDNKGSIVDDWKRSDDGRSAIAGLVQLSGTTRPTLVIDWPGAPSRLFAITLPPARHWTFEMVDKVMPAPPRPAPDYGSWQAADLIEEPGREPQRASDDGVQLRYYLD
jgi:hypothetical protein